MARARVTALEVPQTDGEADELFRQLGSVMHRREGVKSVLNSQVEKLQREAAQQDDPLKLEQDKLVKQLATFAEANRSRLAHGKTIRLSSGIFNWRLTPYKVNVSGGEAKLLDHLIKEGVRRCIRIKREINRDAMLLRPDDAAQLPGVSITRREELYIQPTELGVEIKAKSRAA